MATVYRDVDASRRHGGSSIHPKRLAERLVSAEPPGRPLSIGAMVDLERTPEAGGHLRCWEQIARGALAFQDEIDLTLYVLGQERGEIPLGPNVRICTLKPVLGTSRLPWLNQGGGHTDLAPIHPELARRLLQHDVLHATAVFAFGRTAKLIARWTGRPLIASLHTDFPKFTRIYTDEIVGRVLGSGAVGQRVSGLGGLFARSMQRSIRSLAKRSDHVLYSRRQDRDWLVTLKGADRISRLRRGIDTEIFHPNRRDRLWLERTFGIGDDRFVLLFAGRADRSKNVMTAALAARRLLDEGRPVHFFLAGDGAERQAVRDLLGAHGTTPGHLPTDQLASVYASADLFVFPSESEIMPNVVLEAKASGLPPLVDANEASAQLIMGDGEDGLLVSEATPSAWAAMVDRLITSPAEHAALRKAARRWAEENAPSWRDVVGEDLLPIWRWAIPDRTKVGGLVEVSQ